MARMRLAREFQSAPACCMSRCDSGVIRGLLNAESVVTGTSFSELACSGDWQKAIWQIAVSIDLSTADVEGLHASHKRIETHSSAESLSACSVLRQALNISNQIELHRPEETTAAAIQANQAAVTKRAYTTWSGMHCFHLQRCRQSAMWGTQHRTLKFCVCLAMRAAPPVCQNNQPEARACDQVGWSHFSGGYFRELGGYSEGVDRAEPT